MISHDQLNVICAETFPGSFLWVKGTEFPVLRSGLLCFVRWALIFVDRYIGTFFHITLVVCRVWSGFSIFLKKLWTPVVLTDRRDDYNGRVTTRVPLQHKLKCDGREGVVRATRIHSRIPTWFHWDQLPFTVRVVLADVNLQNEDVIVKVT